MQEKQNRFLSFSYKERYQILFHETTYAIYALQKAQQQAEERYIAGDMADKLVLITSNTMINDNEEKHPPQG